MKNIQKLVCLLILGMLLSAALVSSQAYPIIVKYVNDNAGVLTPEQELSLNLICEQIEKNTSVEVAVVTVKSTNGEDTVLYANRMGEQSGVGKKDKDNGVVVLWSIDDKSGAIATGRGIESVLTDAKVSTIGRSARPYFDKGEYYNGFSSIVTQIGAQLSTPTAKQGWPVVKDPGIALVTIIIVIFGAMLLIMIVISIILAVIGKKIGNTFSSTSHFGRSYSMGNWHSMGGGHSFGGHFGGGFGGGHFGGGGGRF